MRQPQDNGAEPAAKQAANHRRPEAYRGRNPAQCEELHTVLLPPGRTLRVDREGRDEPIERGLMGGKDELCKSGCGGGRAGGGRRAGRGGGGGAAASSPAGPGRGGRGVGAAVPE